MILLSILDLIIKYLPSISDIIYISSGISNLVKIKILFLTVILCQVLLQLNFTHSNFMPRIHSN